MQLFYIRHGQSVNNLLYSTTGYDDKRDCDPELTNTGRKQAKRLAKYLKQENFYFTHLYTSLMMRAVSTGIVIADMLGLSLVAWYDLHEEGGIYTFDEQGNRVGQPGKNRSYFESHYPKLVLPESLGAEGWWNRPFELTAERPVRAQRFLQDLFSRHGGTDHQVAVISHGGFYNLFLSALLNPSPSIPLWFRMNNTAITRIDFLTDRTEVMYSNRTSFLPNELIT